VPAGIVGASVQGRVALGPHAGARVPRLGAPRDTETVTSRGARQAHVGTRSGSGQWPVDT
jgi:hypothetical protein